MLSPSATNGNLLIAVFIYIYIYILGFLFVICVKREEHELLMEVRYCGYGGEVMSLCLTVTQYQLLNCWTDVYNITYWRLSRKVVAHFPFLVIVVHYKAYFA